MIGIFANAIEEFRKYIIENYDLKDGMISLKIRHTYGVVDASEYIAKSIGLDNENIQLARIIALLHDIGRFEQAKQYKDYRDYKNIDHAELGVKILFEEGFIRKFIQDDKYDNIILKAIKNHNKLEIEDGLNEEELLHAKIIRDADKTDILYILTFDEVKTIYETEDMSNEKITDEIYREFLEDRKIDYSKRQNAADTIISHFAYVFDFNFDYGLRYINDNKYIQKLYNRFSFNDKDTMSKYTNAYEITINYIKEKLGE